MCLAVPGKVLSVSGDPPYDVFGRVGFGGIVKEVNLAYVPDVRPGDYVLVHVGFALSKVDPEEAQRVFQYLREMDELEDLKEDTA